MTATAGTSSPTPVVDFLLPGRWWRVPLDSEGQSRRAAKLLARDRVGPADDLAPVRAELVARLAHAADVARQAGGQDMYLALEIVPGAVLPLTLTVYWPQLPVGPTRAGGPRTAAESLASSLRRAAAEANAGTEVAVLDSDEFGLVRTIRSSHPEGTLPEDLLPEHALDDESALPRLVVSYWVIRAGSPRTLLVSFSTPLVPLREQTCVLTDAIVAGLTWRES